MARNALDFAHWFSKHMALSQAWADRVKLQKLLFFSWLIHYVNTESDFFRDDLCAFEHGPVVWNVLYMPTTEYEKFLSRPLPEYTSEEEKTLQLTYEIFGDADSKELEELSHESPEWEKHYKESLIFENGLCVGYDRDKHIMSKENLDAELNMMRNLLYVHEHREELGY
jgi:uncharacterized phage-associated protein